MKLARLAWATMAAAALLLAPAAFAQGIVVDDDPAPVATVVTSAVSQAFFLDTREGPRESTGSEKLAFSAQWDGGEDATVTILQDGVAVAQGLAGEGAWDWRVAANGTYVLEHRTDLGGGSYAVEQATFVVTGALPDPDATLAWKYAKNANGWFCAQVAFTWRSGYADSISNMRLLFRDRMDEQEELTAYLVDPATAIDPLDRLEGFEEWDYRAAPIDLKAFAGLKDGARAVFGVSDATIRSPLASVPKSEQKICLRVPMRSLAAVGDVSAVLAWDSGGKTHYQPLAGTEAGPAPGQASTYAVRFAANGGKGSMAEQTMSAGISAKLGANAFTREGWIFIGWSTTKNGPVAYKDGQSVKDLAAAGKAATLYAAWAKATYKVKFFANDGSGRTAVQAFRYGKKKRLKANAFKRDGYTFAGWAKSKAKAKAGKVAYKNKKAVKDLVRNGKTVKLYAVWKKK